MNAKKVKAIRRAGRRILQASNDLQAETRYLTGGHLNDTVRLYKCERATTQTIKQITRLSPNLPIAVIDHHGMHAADLAADQ